MKYVIIKNLLNLYIPGKLLEEGLDSFWTWETKQFTSLEDAKLSLAEYKRASDLAKKQLSREIVYMEEVED